MLVYAFKGQKCITRSLSYDHNWFALRDEIESHLDGKYSVLYEKGLYAFYDTLNGAVKVNNLLAKNAVEDAKMALEDVLDTWENQVVQDPVLSKITCGPVMIQLRQLYNLLMQNEIAQAKWGVAGLMEQLERDGYVVLSKCNLKRDFQSFSKYCKEG